ncbi:hypothetical protein NOJ05_28220 [Neorhizobium galegae]|uniref:hypothetical protein n=1 Tax=Neorhizobium galegae TaxID=399 RepID=UPI000621CF4C|nr:hypothetical protein [Neorhizobium galegae]MCQ1781110.1 hypothetical protein [Neorhizobium galegae]MCQ1797713.1 hypothetical protein [Neorhizobium galegae]CDZ30983.1 Hypothetical protein NGAL_HAMBI490_58560 [Neorhizobium galegae bv. officinalis]
MDTDQQEPEAARDDARLLEHWKSTLELRNDQYTTFDKAILGVSGGALGLSIVNADKLSGGAATFSQFLLLSWLAFGLSITANISSYWSGAQDAEVEIRKITKAVETGTEYSWGNVFRTTTVVLNFVALTLFFFGVIFLSLHAYRNMEGSKDVSGQASGPPSPTIGTKRNPDAQPGS